MITIEINSDTPLTDPRFDILHAAARDIAEATGQMVRIYSNVTVAPPEKYKPATVADSQIPKPHKWPDLNDSNDWIEWHGGECPVPAGTTIEVKYRDGVVCTTQALNSQVTTERTAESWGHYDHRCDIVAYRIPCTITTSSLLKDQVDVRN